jgi:predicted DNA-binding protein (MmcQ/YjbR family)
VACAVRAARPTGARGAVTPAELRRTCLRQAGAEQTFPFGEVTSVFKVAGRIFALSPLRATPLTVSVKCEPELAERLRDTYPAIEPGYHLNKLHWITITLDGSLPDEMIRDLVEDSYDLVAPKRRRPG